jgi:hypothetical protein
MIPRPGAEVGVGGPLEQPINREPEEPLGPVELPEPDIIELPEPDVVEVPEPDDR